MTKAAAHPRTGPIGIFDSGVGGLTVAAAIRQLLPSEHLLYFGDSVHMPYGERSLEEVLHFSRAITTALLDRGSKLIVIACNAASAASLHTLRGEFPHMRFVGMEPAVKPAVETSQSRVVGVIATSATFQGALFASVVERFAQGVTVLQQACPGLAQRIEAGELDTPGMETLLRGWLGPMLAQGIDSLALGCTHYPLVRPLIERICGPGVRVIDPAPAIARQVERMLAGNGTLTEKDETNGHFECWTSGDPRSMARFLGMTGLPANDVRNASWIDGRLSLA